MKKPSMTKTIASISVAYALATITSGVSAAQPAGASATSHAMNFSDIEEVTVTARRREENLQSVPVSIAVLSGDQLTKQSIINTADLQYHVPGLMFMPGARGNNTPSVSLRGQRQFETLMVVDGPVGMYFAEVPISRPNGLNQALFDMQSVQVLKGPQGTLFGRNTTGGAVLFTPNAPSDKREAMAQVSIGNYNLRDFEGMVNVPMSDTLAIRAAGKITKRDGYMKDVTPGSGGHKADDIDSQAYRFSVTLKPTPSVTSTFIGSYFEADDGGTAFKTINAVPANLPVAGLRPTLATAWARVQNEGKYEYEFNRFTTLSGEQKGLYSKTKTQGLQNTTTWSLNDNLTLKNIIGYRKMSAESTMDLDGTSLLVITYAGYAEQEQWSEEFQVQGNYNNLKWQTGLFYFSEKGSDNGPNNTFATTIGFASDDPSVKARSKSVYINGDYTFESAPKWSVAGGARWNSDRREVISHVRSVVGVNTTYRCLDGVTITGSLGGMACPYFGATANFSKPTFDFTVNYKPQDGWLTYLSHKRGYKSGGIPGRASSVVGLNTPFLPETVNETELGFKSEFAGEGYKARANIAIYNDDYSNVQRTLTLPINGVLTTNIVNAAKAKINGIDAEFMLQLGERWTFTADFAHTNPKYESFSDRGTGGVIVDVSDSKFAGTSKNTVSLTASYDVPMSSDLGKLSLAVTGYHRTAFNSLDINTSNCAGGAYRACGNTPYDTLPGYSLVNLRADWANVMNSKFDLGLFVNNAANKYYLTGSNNQIVNLGTQIAMVGAPRMYGMNLKYKFD